MEADSLSHQLPVDNHAETVLPSCENECSTLNISREDNESNTTVHPFNISNITVIEKTLDEGTKTVSCEGSDSGVEVLENNDNCVFQRTLSSNSGVSNHSHDFEHLTYGAQSCDSSISYCSNYDEAYSILLRRNSTLLEDYTLRNGDRTSENGSESSSITGGSSSSKNSKRNNALNKKKLGPTEAKAKSVTSKDRARSKPPITPRTSSANSGSCSARLKSLDRLQSKPNVTPSITKANCLRSRQVPNNLDLGKKDPKRSSTPAPRPTSATRTPVPTPTDDGRWPSINSKPAPLMSKSFRAILESPPNAKRSIMDTKTIEKYATLPRRRKEKSADALTTKTATSRESSVNRLSIPKKPLTRESVPIRLSTIYKKKRIKIYQESSIQTALTMTDVEKALAGVALNLPKPSDKEFCEKEVQVDMRLRDIENLQEQLKTMTEKYDSLICDHQTQTCKLKEAEERLRNEELEKEGLKLELKHNTERVLTILGESNPNTDDETTSDSLMVLESRFQNVSEVVLNQEIEISQLNALCRSYQIDLERSLNTQRTLIQQHQDQEAESIELQEFMQAEKTTLADALRESESELKKCHVVVNKKEKELEEKQDECKHLVRLSEQRRQENLGLQANLGAMESKCRELLVHQGSAVSGAAVALSALNARLGSLVGELIASYNISEQELEEVIFHNEVYSNSSSSADATPERGRKYFPDRSPSPKKGSSFVSAVINAIKNAAAQSPFAAQKALSRNNMCADASSSNEMLDSETEPCLMMEHVLEDVVIPDGHSHNMVSSTHSLIGPCLTHSESLKDLSQAILNREKSEQAQSLNVSFTSDMGSPNDIFISFSLIDQVVDVDNSITSLLKVIRIIQVESEDCMNELEEHKDSLSEQVQKQKETNKFVVKQLKDWENLGARLKTEVKELTLQLRKRDMELDQVKLELSKQREQVEKQNQDVCELSTALSKIELDVKMKEDEVAKVVKNWDNSGELPTSEILARIVTSKTENLQVEKEKNLHEISQDLLASRQILTESVKEAVSEAKKQYEAIDNALEVLHSIQSVVQQCPPLAKLQRDLEETSFQSASVMPLIVPPDYNANAALLQAVNNLEIASPINTTA